MKYKFLKPILKFRNSIIAITESQSKFYSAIVLACGFILAIGLCLAFRPKFEFHYSGDIVSWLIVNKYPKQQETYYYLLSIILVPSISIAVWFVWLLWSKAVSFFTNLPYHHILKKYALTYLPLILILGNISTPTFKKMLLIPLILFFSANIIFLVYDLLKNRLKKFITFRRATEEQTKSVFEGSSDQHWCVIASGICVGLFVLINYGENPKSLLSCLKIIALSALAVWLFWIICSILFSLFWFYKAKLKSKKYASLNPPLSPFQKGENEFTIEKAIPSIPPLEKGGRGDFSFNEAKAMLVYSHIPLVLLLLVSLLYEHGNALIIISFAYMLILKVLIFIKPAWMMKLVSMRVHRHLLDYILVPAIIYAVFYCGGNINGGIDLFHEGERIAPLNEGLRGGVPYKNVYLQHGLFYNFYRPLLSAKLFGPSLASDRLLGSILDPLGHVGFYLFALQIFRKKLSAFILLWILSSGVTEEFVFWNVARRMVYTPGRLAPAYLALAVLAFYLNRYKFSNPTTRSIFKDSPLYNNLAIKSDFTSTQTQNSPLIKGARGLFLIRIFTRLVQRIFKKNHPCESISFFPLMAGIISCITIFNSLEIGFYTTATCFLFLLLFGFSPMARSGDLHFWKRLINGFRPLLNYIIGICIVFIPISIYLAIYGAFDDMIGNSYIQTRYQSIIWGLRFPPLFSELAKVKSIETIKAFIISDTFKWYMPIVVYLISATYLAYQMLCSRLWKAKSNVKLLLLIIAGIIFFRTMLGRSDSTHLYGMSFAWMLGMYLIESLFIRTWGEFKMDFRTAVSWHSHSPMSTLSHPISVTAWRIVVILTLVWYATSVYNPIDTAKQLSAIVSSYGKVERYVDPPFERAGNMIVPADQASQIKAVVKYIQSNTRSDETIFDFSNQGGYYFFADRPSATRYIQICYASTDAMQIEVIESLKQNKTNLVIFSNSSWMDSIDGVSSLDRHRLIAKYLKDNYVESAKIGTTTFYKRKGN
jgi:hypothetical protein